MPLHVSHSVATSFICTGSAWGGYWAGLTFPIRLVSSCVCCFFFFCVDFSSLFLSITIFWDSHYPSIFSSLSFSSFVAFPYFRWPKSQRNAIKNWTAAPFSCFGQLRWMFCASWWFSSCNTPYIMVYYCKLAFLICVKLTPIAMQFWMRLSTTYSENIGGSEHSGSGRAVSNQVLVPYSTEISPAHGRSETTVLSTF